MNRSRAVTVGFAALTALSAAGLSGCSAAKEEKAYALYRAINCYAPSGNNSCGSQEIPLSQRKGWFNTLKRQYGTSQWAKQLKYYW